MPCDGARRDICDTNVGACCGASGGTCDTWCIICCGPCGICAGADCIMVVCLGSCDPSGSGVPYEGACDTAGVWPLGSVADTLDMSDVSTSDDVCDIAVRQVVVYLTTTNK